MLSEHEMLVGMCVMAHLFCAAQEVLKEYRKQFINHVEADVVASDLRFSGIIPQGCHAQILQTFDRIRRNEILHDQMATSCTREALIVASNIFIGKEGYPQIKALGVAMKKSLETGLHVCLCVCLRVCIHGCACVYKCVCVY